MNYLLEESYLLAFVAIDSYSARKLSEDRRLSSARVCRRRACAYGLASSYANRFSSLTTSHIFLAHTLYSAALALSSHPQSS